MIQQSPTERLDGNDIWEALFGIMRGNVPDELTEALCQQLADALATQAAQPAEADGVERITRAALAEVMQDAWGEICDDSGSHPLDMKHGRGSILFYEPGHWTDLIALRLNERLATTPKAPATDAGEVEPVAWSWEGCDRAHRWEPRLTPYHPGKDNDYCRNVRPLFATPPAPNDDLRAALEWIDYHKDDQDMNHVNFRIGAGSRARDALAALKENRRG
jgi:hypothetical protein